MNNTKEAAKAIAAAFNQFWPVGSEVTVVGDFGDLKETTIKHPAKEYGTGDDFYAVVWLNGISGHYGLWRVIPKRAARDVESDSETPASSVAAFNENWPVGTEVVYVRDFGERVTTHVTAPAQLHSDGDAVIYVNDVVGCVSLWRVTPVNANKPQFPARTYFTEAEKADPFPHITEIIEAGKRPVEVTNEDDGDRRGIVFGDDENY